jgi:hypothetical protein
MGSGALVVKPARLQLSRRKGFDLQVASQAGQWSAD